MASFFPRSCWDADRPPIEEQLTPDSGNESRLLRSIEQGLHRAPSLISEIDRVLVYVQVDVPVAHNLYVYDPLPVWPVVSIAAPSFGVVRTLTLFRYTSTYVAVTPLHVRSTLCTPYCT